MKRKFPTYFNNFVLPEGAGENEFTVYRACKSGQVDTASFLCTYEENGFHVSSNAAEDDPGEYSLSTYEKPRDVKRFAITNSEFRKPFMIAKGTTSPKHGVSQRTNDRKKGKKKTSHIDWWLYEGATPHIEFNMIEDFKQYYEDHKARNEAIRNEKLLQH